MKLLNLLVFYRCKVAQRLGGSENFSNSPPLLNSWTESFLHKKNATHILPYLLDKSDQPSPATTTGHGQGHVDWGVLLVPGITCWFTIFSLSVKLMLGNVNAAPKVQCYTLKGSLVL